MPNKDYSETIWLPKDTQVVDNSYQIKFDAVDPYSAPISAATLLTTHGIKLTPSNYTYARDPEIEYTDFLIETGENSVSYPSSSSAYLKFRVAYPNNGKEVNIVFIIRFGAPPA